MNELPQMLTWIRAQLSSSRFQSKFLHQIELSAEEALSNIIRHGYGQNLGNIEISIKIIPESLIEIRIRDWGPPFNPLTYKREPSLDVPVEEIKEGGLGIFFFTQLLDDVLYERDNTSNLLIFIKHFSQKP